LGDDGRYTFVDYFLFSADQQGGTLVLPAPEVMKQLFLFRSSVGDNDESPERESIESFLYGYV
jgi:hypothetical protein